MKKQLSHLHAQDYCWQGLLLQEAMELIGDIPDMKHLSSGAICPMSMQFVKAEKIRLPSILTI